MDFFDTILQPLMVAVAWIMVQFHNLLGVFGMESDSGLTWALSIVGLVIIMRILLIPLFVKQIKASRGMQLLAPEMQVIQKKYKGKTDPASREAMSRETMELYRKHGTNPFSSCLPILAQSPIFFALFRVLYTMPDLAAGRKDAIGPLTQELAEQFTEATIFGARLSDWFLASDTTSVKIVAAALIILMSATTFTTQKQLTQKNMPASALQGPMAQQQKMLLYILPLVFAISGVNFPIGVLIYWSTTNLWSMGQQFYVIRRNPTPGSEAERLLKERRARKAAAKGIVLEEDKPAIEEKPRGQREQPKRKARTKPPTPAGDAAADGPASPTTRPAGSKGATRPPGASAKGTTGRPAGTTGRPAGTTGAGTGGTKGAGTSKRSPGTPGAPRAKGSGGPTSGSTGRVPRPGADASSTADGPAPTATGPRTEHPAATPPSADEAGEAPTGTGTGGVAGRPPGSRKPRTPKK